MIGTVEAKGYRRGGFFSFLRLRVAEFAESL